SNGQGPGLIGTPFLAVAGVIGLGLLTILATATYVRLTRPVDGRRQSAEDRRRS
ncbi:MAG: hypothetical protein QOF49_1918, partial [Chloroflexota bacterium]|nr:hypothetical protein [Chloroflexota bacterium]